MDIHLYKLIEYSPIQVGLQQTIRITAFLELLELSDGFFAQKLACAFSSRFTVLGKVEPPPCIENFLVKLLQQGAKPRAVFIGHLEIHGE